MSKYNRKFMLGYEPGQVAVGSTFRKADRVHSKKPTPCEILRCAKIEYCKRECKVFKKYTREMEAHHVSNS